MLSGSFQHNISEKLSIPVLQPTFLVGRNQSTFVVDYLVAQEKVKMISKKIHIQVFTQFYTVDYLILAQVRGTDYPCFFILQGRTTLRVGSREPDKRVENEWRHAAVYLWGNKKHSISQICLFPEQFDLLG